MTTPWNVKVTIMGYYGEVTIEQDAPNGVQGTRESVVKEAIKLYEALKAARDGKSITT